MSIEETEILVVGAGPCGLIAAREATERGAKVIVLEEDAEIGRPCHCAGLLSLKGLSQIGVPLYGPYVQNSFRGARFFSPSGLSFTVERDEPMACVVDRSVFDKFLAHQSAHAGVDVRLNWKVEGIKRVNKEIISVGKDTSIGAKILIDAEGASSRIVRGTGLKPLESTRILSGLQFDIDSVDLDPNYVEAHLGRRIAPDFFAWVIPLSSDSARIGLACKGANPSVLLDEFVRKRFGDDRKTDRVATRSGLVVTCGPIEKTFDDNLLIVGDAAGQVKPTTGGGVILGSICASIAGKVAAEALRTNNFASSFLGRYESFWKKELDKEFKTTCFARRLMNNLSDKMIDKLFEVIIEENLPNELFPEGDMDFQRGTIVRLLKRKKILELLPLLWKALPLFEQR